MKNLITIIVLFLLCKSTSAQIENATKDWVDYNKIYYKIQIPENGVYNVSFETLEKAGFPIDSVKGKQLLLINEGKEVPVFVSNEEQWTVDDYLEFYGEKLDGTFDTKLYEKPEHQLHAHSSMFTDTAAYYLTIGLLEERIRLFQSNFINPPEKETYFMFESLYAPFNGLSSGKPNGKHPHTHHPDYLPPTLSNIYFANYTEGEGYYADWMYNRSLPKHRLALVEVNTSSIFKNGPPATLEFKVIGMFDDDSTIFDHQLNINLNNEPLMYDAFGGHTIKTYELEDVPSSRLNSSTNVFEFCSKTDTAYKDIMGLSYMSIHYPRNFNFSDVDTLAFYVEGKDRSQYIEFESLDKNETYFLLDITKQLKIQLPYLGDKKVHAVHLPAAENEKRKLYFYQADKVKSVQNLTTHNFTNFDNLANQGDYIIITHPRKHCSAAICANPSHPVYRFCFYNHAF